VLLVSSLVHWQSDCSIDPVLYFSILIVHVSKPVQVSRSWLVWSQFSLQDYPWMPNGIEIRRCGGQSSTWNDCKWSHNRIDIVWHGHHPTEKLFQPDQVHTNRMFSVGLSWLCINTCLRCDAPCHFFQVFDSLRCVIQDQIIIDPPPCLLLLYRLVIKYSHCRWNPLQHYLIPFEPYRLILVLFEKKITFLQLENWPVFILLFQTKILVACDGLSKWGFFINLFFRIETRRMQCSRDGRSWHTGSI
jgi:hypothetical protein